MRRRAWAWMAGIVLLAGCGGGGRALQQGAPAGDRAVAAGEAAGRTGGASVGSVGAMAAVPEEGDLLVFRITAARDLNTFNSQPHTLVAVFYQLSQSTVFSQLTETPEGRMKLLEGEAFDASVLARRRLVVQPGEVQNLAMDRIEGARYAAVIGGFYNATGPDASRLVAVVPRKSGLPFMKKPVPQVIDLGLGPSGFTR